MKPPSLPTIICVASCTPFPSIATEDKEEALAASWLGLGYHDHDHPADFGGVVLDTSRPGQRRPKCCYVDVKLTVALAPGAQRTKLEQRAQERKFGCKEKRHADEPARLAVEEKRKAHEPERLAVQAERKADEAASTSR